jgi:hypothetical protein
MERDEILRQLTGLLDGYLEANEEHGDGEPCTADFLLATAIVLDTETGFITSADNVVQAVDDAQTIITANTLKGNDEGGN